MAYYHQERIHDALAALVVLLRTLGLLCSLDHVIVLGERHLRRLLIAYLTYYHGARTHLALEKDAPTTRRVQTPTEGPVLAFLELGGLHHRYERRAA